MFVSARAIILSNLLLVLSRWNICSDLMKILYFSWGLVLGLSSCGVCSLYLVTS